MSTQDVHPTAVVEAGARVGEGCRIGPYVVIGPAVELGDNVVVHAHAVIGGNTSIGDATVIHAHAVIGGPPQDLKYLGSDTTLRVGQRNLIREGVTINTGTEQGGGETIVGDDNIIMANAHVAHDCIIGNGCIVANNVMLAGHVVVEDGVNLAGGAGVHHFATVGKYAYIGGLTRLTRDAPPYTIVEGHPMRVRGVNVVGLKRAGLDDVTIKAIKDCFKMLFKSDDPLTESVDKARAEFAGIDEVIYMINFVEASNAGRQGRQEEDPGRDLMGG
ncbi:MAG: acyl-ACP--UDP-N-acetylglucosamine O-acyltransferase [Planctomycetota bacterium]